MSYQMPSSNGRLFHDTDVTVDFHSRGNLSLSCNVAHEPFTEPYIAACTREYIRTSASVHARSSSLVLSLRQVRLDFARCIREKEYLENFNICLRILSRKISTACHPREGVSSIAGCDEKVIRDQSSCSISNVSACVSRMCIRMCISFSFRVSRDTLD